VALASGLVLRLGGRVGPGPMSGSVRMTEIACRAQGGAG
jgi:hypothetical protein